MKYLNKFVLSLVISTVCQISWGQADSSLEPSGAALQRQRIELERLQFGAELDAQELACQDKFAVTACVQEVTKRRIAMQSKLKRQETILNDAERRERAQQQRQRMAEKQVERERKAVEADASVQTDQAEKKKVQDEKRRQHKEQGATPAPQRSQENVAPGAGIQSQSPANAAAYNEKVENVRVKRLEREKRLKESKPGVTSLPVPP